jgi:AcrR family transcriptional regulator
MSITRPAHRDKRRPGKKADLRAETRQALILAAQRRFAAEGCEAPSLDDICADAGYTRGAFYVHFKDREDLIMEVMREVSDRFFFFFLQAHESVELRTLIENFAALVMSGFFPPTGVVTYHDLLGACARSPALRAHYQGLVRQVVARLEPIIARDQVRGLVRADIPAAQLAVMAQVLVLGIQGMLDAGVPYDQQGLAQAVLRIFAPLPLH